MNDNSTRPQLALAAAARPHEATADRTWEVWISAGLPMDHLVLVHLAYQYQTTRQIMFCKRFMHFGAWFSSLAFPVAAPVEVTYANIVAIRLVCCVCVQTSVRENV